MLLLTLALGGHGPLLPRLLLDGGRTWLLTVCGGLVGGRSAGDTIG